LFSDSGRIKCGFTRGSDIANDAIVLAKALGCGTSSAILRKTGRLVTAISR
jgi:hypothetical protein